MKLIKFLLLTVFLNSFTSFGQATSNGATLTVTDLSGNYVYYEYNFTATGGFISEFGPGAPLNTPVKIKLSSGAGSIPQFTTGDLNGNCDSYQTGSMNATNTEFITTLNSCCPSVAEMRLSNGLRFWVTIKCAPSGSTDVKCITFAISASCNLSCITFYLPANIPLCMRAYTVVISFADGSTTTILPNFATGNTTFCFPKTISTVVSSNFSTCRCISTVPPLRQAANNDKITPAGFENNKISISPNPVKSVIKFTGSDLSKYKISIFNPIGTEIIKNAKIDAEISIEHQTNGLYMYIITDENGYRQEGKFIKN